MFKVIAAAGKRKEKKVTQQLKHVRGLMDQNILPWSSEVSSGPLQGSHPCAGNHQAQRVKWEKKDAQMKRLQQEFYFWMIYSFNCYYFDRLKLCPLISADLIWVKGCWWFQVCLQRWSSWYLWWRDTPAACSQASLSPQFPTLSVSVSRPLFHGSHTPSSSSSSSSCLFGHVIAGTLPVPTHKRTQTHTWWLELSFCSSFVFVVWRSARHSAAGKLAAAQPVIHSAQPRSCCSKSPSSPTSDPHRRHNKPLQDLNSEQTWLLCLHTHL